MLGRRLGADLLREAGDGVVASVTRVVRVAGSPARGAGLEVLLRAVEIPRLVKDHRFVAPDRRAQQRVRAPGPGRRDNGEAGGVHEPRFERLGVLSSEAESATR